MRRDEALGMLEETAAHVRRLFTHHIDRRAANRPGLQRVGKGILVYHWPSRCVHEYRIAFHALKTPRINQPLRLRRKRTVYGNVI